MGAYGDETHNFDFIKAMLKQKNSIPLSQAVIKEAVQMGNLRVQRDFSDQ